jgi:hypothetical protein
MYDPLEICTNSHQYTRKHTRKHIHVHVQALSASPARLLGQEVVIDAAANGCHGLSSDIDTAYCVGNAKITYPVRWREKGAV